MTAMETWVVELVKILVGDMPETCEPDWGEAFGRDHENCKAAITAYREDWRLLGQRSAVLLIQSRALECRHLASELMINAGSHPIYKGIAQQLWERSHKLEAIGLQFANEWPPIEGREIMVCRCQIEHHEIKEGEVFICAHCKLPKRGAAAPGPVLVQ